MRKIVSKFALAAGLVLAMALTFSCSSDGGGGATYWYSIYGIKDASYTNYILGLQSQYENPSYDDIRYIWSEVKRVGIFIESNNGISEQEIKTFFIQRDISPKEADYYLARLKKRGNDLGVYTSGDIRYHSAVIYAERE